MFKKYSLDFNIKKTGFYYPADIETAEKVLEVVIASEAWQSRLYKNQQLIDCFVAYTPRNDRIYLAVPAAVPENVPPMPVFVPAAAPLNVVEPL